MVRHNPNLHDLKDRSEELKKIKVEFYHRGTKNTKFHGDEFLCGIFVYPVALRREKPKSNLTCLQSGMFQNTLKKYTPYVRSVHLRCLRAERPLQGFGPRGKVHSICILSWRSATRFHGDEFLCGIFVYPVALW